MADGGALDRFAAKLERPQGAPRAKGYGAAPGAAPRKKEYEDEDDKLGWRAHAVISQ